MAKILLVEDDKSLREIYSVRLQAEGYTIVSAGDGEEALAMAIKERPDLIVSDVMMPKISGFDMLDILRSTTETKDVKVIMMTALSSDDQRARGESLGADRYLVKSQVGIEDVVRTVHDVLADGIPAPAAPSAAPSFTSAPAPAPESMAPAAEPAPAPAPVTPAPVQAPVVEAPQPATPSEPLAAPAPVEAAAPVAAQPVAQPAAAPAPVTPVAAPATPVAPAQPAAQPAMPITDYSQPPQPVFPPTQPAAAPAASPLPQPIAPFSTAAPASVGERVIQPLTNPADLAPAADLSAQMDQALGNTAPNPQAPGTPPVPPAL